MYPYQVIFEDENRKIEIKYQIIDQLGRIQGVAYFCIHDVEYEFVDVTPIIENCMTGEKYKLTSYSIFSNELVIEKFKTVRIATVKPTLIMGA